MMTLNRKRTVKIGPALNTLLIFIAAILAQGFSVEARDYYYTRTRSNPNHLRVSEELKNKYVDEVKYESKINGTNYEYYKSTLTMNHDELIFETIDKIFRHRLSSFYLHHYDSEDDKKRSYDEKTVSNEACARDLMYLVDKIPRRGGQRGPNNLNDEDHISPELTAFFDSYARQEPGVLMGNTFWVGAYDQCVNRHIFELTSSVPYHPGSFPVADVRSKETDRKVVSFKGRYCVAAIRSPNWDKYIATKRVRARNYFKTQRQMEDYSKLFRIQMGICLPDSCDSTSLERHRDEIKLLTTSMLDSNYESYELSDLYCIPDETSPLRAWNGSALYFIMFMVVWFTIIFLATVADIFEFADALETIGSDRRGKSKLRLAITWFSLRANYRKLMLVSSEEESEAKAATKSSSMSKAAKSHVPEKTSIPVDANSIKQSGAGAAVSTSTTVKVNLRFLNAFKVLIMFWIINGHIMLLMIQTAKNILNSDALLNGLMHFLIGATFGVDLFFTMTGFLTSYLIFNSNQAYRMRASTWIYLSFHRYWRLMPLYVITFWFSRSVMQMLGSGPLWDYGTSNMTFRGLCNHESWWYPLTLTSNLHGLFEECIITSWYISCDMQFWLVSPVFIYLLAKKPIHGWVLSVATILMSSKLRYDSIMEDNSARHDELVKPRADIFMRVSHDLPALYTHPHYRISAYIVGLLAGHYVYMVKSGKWKSTIAEHETMKTCSKELSASAPVSEKLKSGIRRPNYHRRTYLAYLGLFLICVMSFVSYILSQFFPVSLLRYSRNIAAAAYSVDHLAMSIGASLVITAMCFGQWSKIVKFLSHPNWTRLSKINYALLLLQCEAIYYQIFRYDQVPVAGTRELINILFNLLVTLYPIAFAVTLAFEFPLANIEKLLI